MIPFAMKFWVGDGGNEGDEGLMVMKGDDDEGRLWSPLEAWMKVWRFWSEKGETRGEDRRRE